MIVVAEYLLVALAGIAVEVGWLRRVRASRLRRLAANIARLEGLLGVGKPLDQRIAEAVAHYRSGVKPSRPWDGMTLEELDTLTDPDVKVVVWPAGIPPERRRR